MAEARKTETRKFSRIFQAKVTFDRDVVVSDTVKGDVYARSDASVVLPDGKTVRRTVMAFGPQLRQIQSDFVHGASAVFAVQHDRGTMKLIGYPRNPDEAKAA